MKRINVTESFLPPRAEYQKYVDEIWKNNQLTNQGPLLKQFERAVEKRLGVANFHLLANGTLALQVALKALDITNGEIITTPFSYVATASSILWERCKPVFVDIDPFDLCIDVAKIEAAITEQTKAIMPVHVFGYACDVTAIKQIAEKYGLKVIYDGAHAFGASKDGTSLLAHGDISMTSFHATKLLHTIEGGGLMTASKELSDRIELIKRFGHDGDEHYMLGTNAKASEFQAAMGLCNLKYVDQIIADRKIICDLYDSLLANQITRPKSPDGYNYAYYPAIFKNEETLLAVMSALQSQEVYPRRYFYPSLNTLPYVPNRYSCPISESTAQQILCLPLYSGLDPSDVERIAKIIIETVKAV